MAVTGSAAESRARHQIAIDTDAGATVLCDAHSGERHLERSARPPAVVIGSVPGERLRADVGEAPSVAGSGLGFGMPFSVTESGRAARLPLAYCWLGLQFTGTPAWMWERQGSPAQKVAWHDAIAEYATRVALNAHPRAGESTVCLAVPNSLDLDGQTAVLRSLRGRGARDCTLLWRPIAAALAWLARIPESGAVRLSSRRSGVLGRLLVVDLSLAGFEVTTLELIREPSIGGERVLPARHLPVSPVLHAEGVRVADFLGVRMSAKAWQRAPSPVWNGVWCGDLLQRLQAAPGDDEESRGVAAARGFVAKYAAVASEGITLPDDSSAHGGLVWRCTPSMERARRPALSYPVEDGPPRNKRTFSSHDLSGWLERVRRDIAGGPPIVGAAVVGALSGLLDGRARTSTLGETLAHALAPSLDPAAILVESISEGVGVVADGAARFLGLSARGETAYLDTLPELETLGRQMGEPAWVPLLEQESRYVPGGQLQTYETAEGFASVGAEESELKLTVWQEGAPTVREVEFAFPRPVEAETPVQLVLGITPGQGNPRVEVVPIGSRLFSGRRFYLDWARAKETGKTRDEAADEMDRLFPPLEPRIASNVCWAGGYWLDGYDYGGVSTDIAEFIRRWGKTKGTQSLGWLRELREPLRKEDTDLKNRQIPDHGTAVGSEGRIANTRDEALLAEFVMLLDGWLANGLPLGVEDEIFRVLGYCSADTPNLRRRMATLCRTPFSIRPSHLIALGNCLRSPASISNFIDGMVGVLSDPEKGANNWLAALCRILMYRENALENASSESCDELIDILLERVNAELRKQNFQYIYRHASLSIAYMLRHRRHDPGYFDPNGSNGRRTKHAFRRALKLLRSGEVRKLGGFRNLDVVTERILEYIDKRGRGRLIFA